MPAPARVILGVGAGIAAYKACELLRLLTESGYRVRVVPTPDALRFVGEATWAALSGEPVSTAARAMEKAGAAVVLVEGKPAGMITRQDVLTYLAAGG